jgi:2-polyprenyl-6-hydroxyphenyl methylase/3-demethylubiquinone-9 3-methyltransferase
LPLVIYCKIVAWDGVIVCKDGFTATTFFPEDFLRLAAMYKVSSEIHEIDRSSLFCVMTVR